MWRGGLETISQAVAESGLTVVQIALNMKNGGKFYFGLDGACVAWAQCSFLARADFNEVRFCNVEKLPANVMISKIVQNFETVNMICWQEVDDGLMIFVQ